MIIEITHKDSLLLKSKDTSLRVLYFIILQADTERLVWFADKIHKEELSEKACLSSSTLDKVIRSLKEKEFLIPSGRGRYLLNENIFTL